MRRIVAQRQFRGCRAKSARPHRIVTATTISVFRMSEAPTASRVLRFDQPSSGIPEPMPDEDQLSLRQADQIRGDLYAIQDDLDFIKVQLAQLPTRNEVWRAAMLGMLRGAVAAVTLVETFARSGL
jgi:hypothetical protein